MLGLYPPDDAALRSLGLENANGMMRSTGESYLQDAQVESGRSSTCEIGSFDSVLVLKQTAGAGTKDEKEFREIICLSNAGS